MYGIILKLIYIALLAFMIISLFICLRDLILGRNKAPLTASIVGILLAICVFLFQTSALPIVIVPLILMVAVPIFLTDKNRNWDFVDHVYRYVSALALLGAIFMTVNAMIR